jgi:hypothetical protein
MKKAVTINKRPGVTIAGQMKIRLPRPLVSAGIKEIIKAESISSWSPANPQSLLQTSRVRTFSTNS